MNNSESTRSRTIIRSAAAFCLPSLLALMLSGCGVLQAPEAQPYERAQQTRDLELPPDLQSPGSSVGVPDIVAAEASAGDLEGFEEFKQLERLEEFERYQQWKAQGNTDDQLDFQAFLAARRAAREGSNDGVGVSIVRNVNQSRDVVIEADAESTWQYVEAALTAMNVQILARNRDDYQFEVALPDVQQSSLFRPGADKFGIQIGRDQRNMVVALVDRNGARVTTEPAQQFMDRLAGQIRVAKVRIELDQSASPILANRGAMRTTDAGHLELDLTDGPELVWSQIDYVVDQIGFTVLERSREKLSFKLRYITDDQVPEERSGLSKLAFWKKDQSLPEGSDVYSVDVTDTASGATIRVLDSTGQPSEIGDSILELLREKL